MAEMDVVNSQVLKEIDENDYDTEQSYSESGPEKIYGILLKLSSMISSTYIGQYLIEKLDKILSTVETTGKWSLPREYSSTFSYGCQCRIQRLSGLEYGLAIIINVM